MFILGLLFYAYVSGNVLYDEDFNYANYDQIFGFEDYNPTIRKDYNKYPIKSIECGDFERTEKSGYVVMMLYKSSGRFMGMGGIITKKTVLTAEKAITLACGDANKILVLAGYLSPWWGKDSQVRKGLNMIMNEYEIVLVEVTPPWNFNNKIYAIDSNQKTPNSDQKYEGDVLIYGIHTNTDFASGDRIPKKTMYSAIKHNATKENNCGKDYPDLKPGFNNTVHSCLHPNASFCSGCVGSPVVATRTKSFIKDIVGVVVRSNCLLESRRVLTVKTAFFVKWIWFNAFFA